MSPRSLQRHLAGMGTSYSDMVAEVRLDTACHLLLESNERISEIALRLGYAGASSFSRVFMRWTKMQPVIYRRQRAVQGNDKSRLEEQSAQAVATGAKWQDAFLAKPGVALQTLEKRKDSVLTVLTDGRYPAAAARGQTMLATFVSYRRGYWREMARHLPRLPRNSRMKTISRCSWHASNNGLSWGGGMTRDTVIRQPRCPARGHDIGLPPCGQDTEKVNQ